MSETRDHSEKTFEKTDESAEKTTLKLADDSSEHSISISLYSYIRESTEIWQSLPSMNQPHFDIKEQGTKPELLYKPEQ